MKEYTEGNCGGPGAGPPENFWYLRWLNSTFCNFSLQKSVEGPWIMPNNLQSKPCSFSSWQKKRVRLEIYKGERKRERESRWKDDENPERVRKKIITQKATPSLRKYWKPEPQLRSIVYIDAGAADGAVDAHAASVHPWKPNRCARMEKRSSYS